MSLLNVKTDIYGSILMVRLKGELDHHTSTDLRITIDKLMKERKEINHLVLNLKDLSFMDSSGLGVILGRYKEIERKKGKMIVCSLNPTIYRILEMAGLFKIIAVVKSEKEALTKLGVA